MKPCRIVVADDNTDTAESLALILRSEGHEVRVATDGTRALEMIVGFRPQVALLDLGMPGLDGYEVAREVRKAGESPRPVLVAVTGWTQPHHQAKARAAGYDHYCAKPVEPSLVTELLANVGCGPEDASGLRPDAHPASDLAISASAWTM